MTNVDGKCDAPGSPAAPNGKVQIYGSKPNSGRLHKRSRPVARIDWTLGSDIRCIEGTDISRIHVKMPREETQDQSFAICVTGDEREVGVMKYIMQLRRVGDDP